MALVGFKRASFYACRTRSCIQHMHSLGGGMDRWLWGGFGLAGVERLCKCQVDKE